MIILQGITVDELLGRIDQLIEEKISGLKDDIKAATTIRNLTRKEVAKMLNISQPTLNNWTKEGLLPSYRIGSRVYYKSHEVDDALRKRNYRR